MLVTCRSMVIFHSVVDKPNVCDLIYHVCHLCNLTYTNVVTGAVSHNDNDNSLLTKGKINKKMLFFHLILAL